MARGDHIMVKRWGGLYYHHGIDVGDGTVIHFSGEPLRTSDACIVREDMDVFLEGRPPLVVEHPDTQWEADEVVERALCYLGCKGYDLFNNNCEHFAFLCKTGTRRSQQVERALWRAAILATGTLATGSAAVVAIAGLHIRRRYAR